MCPGRATCTPVINSDRVTPKQFGEAAEPGEPLNACAAEVNDARRAAGFALCHWWHEDAPEPRDSHSLELALVLENAGQRLGAAERELKDKAPGAEQRWETAKAERDWWFTTTWVILSYRPLAAC